MPIRLRRERPRAEPSVEAAQLRAPAAAGKRAFAEARKLWFLPSGDDGCHESEEEDAFAASQRTWGAASLAARAPSAPTTLRSRMASGDGAAAAVMAGLAEAFGAPGADGEVDITMLAFHLCVSATPELGAGKAVEVARWLTDPEAERSAAKRTAELRRAAAEAKLAREERKAEEREAERAKKELKRIEKALKKQRDRDKRYDDAKRMERSRSARIMLKHEEEDVRLARAEEERRKELEMQTLKKRLTLEEKMENVEMTERRRQYEAALLLEKIERDTARAKAVNAAREGLAQQRRLENYELSLERELLLHADAPGIRRVSSIKAKHRPVSARPLGTRWR